LLENQTQPNLDVSSEISITISDWIVQNNYIPKGALKMTITQASRQIFQKYLTILKDKFIEEKNPHILERILQLIAMFQTVINYTCEHDDGENLMSEDKISRWLGFVQGVMTVYGWVTVEEERETTRPLFHKAYEDSGLLKPESIAAKLDDIHFHIEDIQELNRRCIEKYNCTSYKNISKKKQLKICFEIMKKSKPSVYKTLKKLNYTVEFNTSDNYNTFIFSNLKLRN